MKNILVTGSYGQLGNEIRCLVPQFSDFHFIFTDVDSLNISDFEKLNNFFEKQKIHFVINCAAYTAVDKCETDFDNAMKINYLSVKYLAELSKTFSFRLIHISTDYVFDGKSCVPYKESDATNPLSKYGISKLEGEKAVWQESENFLILRTSWLYSSFGNNFLKTILRVSKEKNELKVVFDQIGTPTFAADLAFAILKILTFNTSETGIFHFSNEGVCSWYDFATEILKFSHSNCKILPIETKDYPTPAVRPTFSVFNKSKIKEIFNFSIPHWRESLEKCIKLL